MRLYHPKPIAKAPDLPRCVLFHGLFGDHGNLRAIASKIGFCNFLPDLINHGNSPRREGSTLEQFANDIVETFEQYLPAVIIGHSMGAKVAMAFASFYPQHCKALIFLDMVNRDYPPERQDNNFNQLQKIEGMGFKSRREANDLLASGIPNAPLRNFLLKNLVFKDDEYRLRLTTSNLRHDQVTLVNQLQLNKHSIPTLFLMAENGYALEDDKDYINAQAANATHIVLPDCGHWLHGEKPNEVVHEITQFLALQFLAMH